MINSRNKGLENVSYEKMELSGRPYETGPVAGGGPSDASGAPGAEGAAAAAAADGADKAFDTAGAGGGGEGGEGTASALAPPPPHKAATSHVNLESVLEATKAGESVAAIVLSTRHIV